MVKSQYVIQVASISLPAYSGFRIVDKSSGNGGTNGIHETSTNNTGGGGGRKSRSGSSNRLPPVTSGHRSTVSSQPGSATSCHSHTLVHVNDVKQ